jgi:hypothetical protein
MLLGWGLGSQKGIIVKGGDIVRSESEFYQGTQYNWISYYTVNFRVN